MESKMKHLNQEDRIQIIDGPTNIDGIIRDLTSRSTTHDEPFYVFDIGEVVTKHQIWIEKMPRVTPHYAVKCNDSDLVLATLAALGAGFDCASKAEISKILKLGVHPDRIIFAHSMKPGSHIRHASATNVKTMTFDSESELQKIKLFCPDAKLVLRIRCDAEVAQCPLGKKFGCDPVSEGPHLIKAARALNLDVVGISFHVGSGCADYPIYYKAIGMAKVLFDYAETIGFKFNLLDIGGGFPGDKEKTIDDVALYVNQGLDQFFPDKSVKVIAEPGRYYVASAYTLVCNIQSKRVCLNAKTGVIDRIMYYINDGIYGSFNGFVYDHQHQLPKLLNYPDTKEYDSTIWGPTCDGSDQIIESIRLPELDIEDWLVFENMGAYTLPTASPFNGFPLPKIHCYVKQDIWEMLKNLITSLDEDIFMMHNNSENNLNLSNHFENVVFEKI